MSLHWCLWLSQLSSQLSDICGGIILFTAEGCNNKQLDWMQQLQKGFSCNNWIFLSIFGWDWKLSRIPCEPFSELCSWFMEMTVQPQYLMASPTSPEGYECQEVV